MTFLNTAVLNSRSLKTNVWVFLKGLDFRQFAFWAASALWISLTFSKAFMEIFFTLMLCFWLLSLVFRQSSSFTIPKKIWIPLLVFLGLVLLSVFFSEFPKNSYRGLLKISKQALTFIIVTDLLCELLNRRRFEKVFLFTAWLIFTNGFFQYVFGRDFLRFDLSEPSGAGPRLSASFGTYGKFASYLITTLPYLWTLGLYYRDRVGDLRRWYLVLLISPFSLALLLWTRSRGALLAFIVSVATTFLLLKKFRWFSVTILTVGVILMLMPRNMVIHLDSQLKEQSMIERLFLWDRAVQVIKAKPLTGTGINTYTEAHSKYDKRKNWRVKHYYAHNGYLQLAAETGLPCVLAFLWFLGAYLWDAFKKRPGEFPESNLRYGLLAGILGFLFFAMIDTVLQNPQPAMSFWFLLGIQLAYMPSTQKPSSPIVNRL